MRRFHYLVFDAAYWYGVFIIIWCGEVMHFSQWCGEMHCWCAKNWLPWKLYVSLVYCTVSDNCILGCLKWRQAKEISRVKSKTKLIAMSHFPEIIRPTLFQTAEWNDWLNTFRNFWFFWPPVEKLSRISTLHISNDGLDVSFYWRSYSRKTAKRFFAFLSWEHNVTLKGLHKRCEKKIEKIGRSIIIY